MTLYKLIKQVSNILTPHNDAFFRYAIYTFDDNGGFLRTRYCWRLDKPLKDKELSDNFRRVLVTSRDIINIDNLLVDTDTLVKLQLTYSEPDATVEDALWDVDLGYNYVYIFDLINGVYTMSYVKNSYL